MVQSHQIFVVAAAVLFFALPVARGKPDPNTKLVGRFEVRIASTEATASTSDDSLRKDLPQEAIDRLQFPCEVTILDPNLVIGISRLGMATEFENDKGDIVSAIGKIPSHPASSDYGYYWAPSYRIRSVALPKPSGWKGAIQRILRRYRKGPRKEWTNQLLPYKMTLEVDSGLVGSDSEKIPRIKGHFYVLVAESLEHIDVPFRPSEERVRLTPDLEIKVVEAQSTASQYRYRIYIPQGRETLKDLISPGSDLPKRLPVRRQFLGKDAKPTLQNVGATRLPPLIRGQGRGKGGNFDHIKTIRFVIAVNPSHHKIPFELEDVPLPTPSSRGQSDSRSLIDPP